MSLKPFVIFDIGGVLVSRAGHAYSIADHLRKKGLGPISDDRLNEAYWSHRDRYDLGCTNEDYWTAVLQAGDVTPTPQLCDELALLDGQLSAQLSDDTAQLLTQLKDAGVGLGILSNAPIAMRDAVHDSSWFSRFFEFGVFSCDIKVAKPEAKSYEYATQLAHDSAQDSSISIVFFDDRPTNVEAAAQAGWEAHVWQGVPAAVTKLAFL